MAVRRINLTCPYLASNQADIKACGPLVKDHSKSNLMVPLNPILANIFLPIIITALKVLSKFWNKGKELNISGEFDFSRLLLRVKSNDVVGISTYAFKLQLVYSEIGAIVAKVF